MSRSVMGNFKMDGHYIISRPRRVTELDEADLFFDQLDYKLQDKARRLQARRWRKIKYQIV